jgi:hypothetical protein
VSTDHAKPIPVRLNARTRERLALASTRMSVSRSALIRMAIDRCVDRISQQEAPMPEVKDPHVSGDEFDFKFRIDPLELLVFKNKAVEIFRPCEYPGAPEGPRIHLTPNEVEWVARRLCSIVATGAAR